MSELNALEQESKKLLELINVCNDGLGMPRYNEKAFHNGLMKAANTVKRETPNFLSRHGSKLAYYGKRAVTGKRPEEVIVGALTVGTAVAAAAAALAVADGVAYVGTKAANKIADVNAKKKAKEQLLPLIEEFLAKYQMVNKRWRDITEKLMNDNVKNQAEITALKAEQAKFGRIIDMIEKSGVLQKVK